MLISVIIPVYKVERYIHQCIDSIIAQDYSDLEIILVDDGSPDNCGFICDEYAKKDNRIKVIHKTNGGLSSARNAGIRFAKAEYIIFMDSDDWWNVNVSLKKMIDVIKANYITDMFLFTSYDYFEGEGYYKRNEHYNLDKIRTDSVEHYYHDVQNNGNLEVSACTKVLKKSFIISNNLFFKEGIVTEDSEWMIRLLRVANDIKIINEPLYLCRCKRQGSISNTVKVSNQIDTLSIVENSLEYWKDKEGQIKKLELCFAAYLWFCSLAIASRYNKIERKKIEPYFQKTRAVCKYSSSKKTRMAYIFYRLFGYSLAMKVLGEYLSLRGTNFGRTKVSL